VPKLHGEPEPEHRAAPPLGQDTVSVLNEILGYPVIGIKA
jgi:hypothetical protein